MTIEDTKKLMRQINTLQAPCKTFIVEKAPTPGFILTADKYEDIGPFNTTLHISYLAGAGQTVRIVNSDPITGDSCLTTDIILDPVTGMADIPYNVAESHVIYAIIKTGANQEDCCTSFDQILCEYSNYVTFEVTTPPATGSLMFISDPSGAEIFLAPTGQTPVDQGIQTPNTISNLIAGQSYDYILRKTYFNDAIGTIIVQADTTVTINEQLIPNEGCIYFKTNPAGATIFIDGVEQTELTPSVICELSLGSHIYELRLDGYQPITDSIDITAGEGEIVSKDMVPIVQAGIGGAGILLVAGAVGLIYMASR